MLTRLFIFLFLFSCVTITYAQKEDKEKEKEKKSLAKKAFREGWSLISTTPKDTIENEKSINPYLQYSGKIIRYINIERIGFEKSIYDSSKKVNTAITKLANALHVNTREKTIRQHLFVHKNKPLNPYRLADNERYIRDRDFILDCRIVVLPIEGTDSVDLTVVTRDVFSLGGTIGGSFPTAPEIGIFDANVAGRAQRVQVTTLIDQERTPKVGTSILYRKSSIFGSLTNLEFEYTELNDGRSIGKETEYAFITRLFRPLVSPYSRWAGGLEVSQNWSKNVYGDADSAFLKYSYNIFDGFIGYNIGIKKEISNRNRQLIAFRYYDGNYTDQPEQPEYEEARKYNSSIGYLSEFTFYRQNYYKTRYVFGFGRTEDVPYGISFGVTGGFVRQLHIGRPYGGVRFNFGEADKKGSFYRFNLQAGGYYQDEKLEDLVVMVGGAYFTKLLHFGSYKMRNYVSATYSLIKNQTIMDWFEIDRNQIPGFSLDSLNDDHRLAMHLETVLYAPWSLLGFRFAPFVAIDLVEGPCETCEPPKNLFAGFSGGFRTRNENLIFGTMEVKFTYIPDDGTGSSKFVFGFKENIRIKSSGSFVRPPSIIRYN